MAVLAAGRSAGVEQGYVFHIFRGSTYKGEIRITLVEEERSEGTILRMKNVIEPGDPATTYL